MVTVAALTGLLLTLISFTIFSFEALVKLNAKADAAKLIPPPAADNPHALAAPDIDKAADSLARLLEAINKSTPGAIAILASLAFFFTTVYLVKPTSEQKPPTPANTTR